MAGNGRVLWSREFGLVRVVSGCSVAPLLPPYVVRLHGATIGQIRIVSDLSQIDTDAGRAFEANRDRAELLLGGPCSLAAAAPRLHQGWELYEWIWLVECNGGTVALSTDHGSLRIIDAASIRDDLARYETAAASVRGLLGRLP